MFILSTLSTTIPLHPSTFSQPTLPTLTTALNSTYANRIIPTLGFCIALYDILQTSSGLIQPTTTVSPLDNTHSAPGAGLVHINATFRLIIFRPFKGEVLEGVISACDESGITVSLEFFNDIHVPCPSHVLNEEGNPTFWKRDEGVWVWMCDGAPYYFDKHERVRFRVEEEVWVDVPPGRARKAGDPGGEARKDGGLEAALRKDEGDLEDSAEVAYRLIARMDQPGLGLVNWWEDEE